MPLSGDRQDCRAQCLKQLRPNFYLIQCHWRLPGSCEKDMSASTTSDEIKEQVADQNYFWQSNRFS